MRLSLLTQLLIVIGLILLLALGSFGWYTSVQINGTLKILTENSVNRTGPLVQGAVESFLTGPQRQSQACATILGSGSDQAITAADFPSVADELIQEFIGSKELAFMSFSLAGTGDYMHLQRTTPDGKKEEIHWQTSIQQADGTYQMKDYLWNGEIFKLTETKDHWDYDPRTRPFYKEAADAKATTWTHIYPMRNKYTKDRQEWGTSCATPVYSNAGALVGVATVDISLSRLNRYIQTLGVGEGTFVYVLDEDDEGRMTILGVPQTGNRLLQAVPNPEDPAVESLDKLDPQIRDEIQPMIKDYHNEEGLEQSDAVRQFAGKEYQAWTGTYYGGHGPLNAGFPDWTVFAVASDKDFLGDISQVRRVLSTFVAATIVLAMGLAFILAQRVVQPLRKIAEETNSIRQLDLEDRPNPRTSVYEVEMLNNSVDSMKGTLRSMIKLVPREYAHYLIERGQEVHAGGERKQLTILFADLVGFTSFSEVQTPERVFNVLDDYLTIMGDAVNETEGTIDKFTGDGLMAFWGAPLDVADPIGRACDAALRTEHKLPEAQEHSGQAMQITYGIATGEVLVGNIGTPSRLNYTVIGDAANLAARLQGLNKVLGTTMLLDEWTATQAKDFLTRPVAWTVVQGRNEPFVAYELICKLTDATSEQKRLAQACRRIMTRLRKGDRADALNLVREAAGEFPNDRPLDLMQEMLLSHADVLLPFDPRTK